MMNAIRLPAITVLTSIILAGCARENAYAPPPPPVVTVASPLRQDVTTYYEFTGRVAAKAEVELRARVPGFLAAQHYEDGAIVEQDAAMFTIERAPYEAALLAAQAALADARATAEKAEFDYNKVRDLQAGAVASEQELVGAKAAYESAKAAVDAARAALQKAELELSYTDIRAPLRGHANRALVEVGDLVGQGAPTLLTTIVQWDPLYVYFTVGERDVLEFRRMRAAEGGGPLKPLPVLLRLADGTDYPHVGVLDYADNRVDPETGTVEARAVVENPDKLLVPGIFARVRIPSETRQALLVPQTALQRDLVGYFALVVDEQGEVVRRDVEVGEQLGRLRVITSGLDGDERLIVNGLQRVRPGIKVQIEQATLEPPALPATQPAPSTNAAASE